jgi:glycosyltransferase involved in cell wall biosynthesis
MEFEVTVVGDGRLRPSLEMFARRHGVAAKFGFVGSMASSAAVRVELDASDIFVLPSRTEGLPRALVEAMARALPCIASNVGGIPELLAREDLVPPSNASALATKLSEVLSSPRRMERMSARNLAEARRYVLTDENNRQRAFFEYLRSAAMVQSNLSPNRTSPSLDEEMASMR